MKVTIEALSNPALVVARRLRSGPLTEFKLASEVACHSGYSPEQATEELATWAQELFDRGLIWSGVLSNRRGHGGGCAHQHRKANYRRRYLGAHVDFQLPA